MTRALAFLALAITTTGACGGGGPFTLTGGDNDPAKLDRVLEGLESGGAIRNKLGTPLAAVVTAKDLTLIDLAAGSARWTVPATVVSRVVVGRDVVVALEKSGLVARAIDSGKSLWSKRLSGDLVGHDADRGIVFVTTSKNNRWSIAAYDAGSGKERWAASAGGALGAPATSRGIVLVPFLNQWLAVLDARTGKSLTRVRSVEAEIEFVRARGGDVFFGSADGVFLFDRKAASGSRAQATYGSAAVPPAFATLRYDRDGYDARQAAYNAFDRRQLLWHGTAGDGSLSFAADSIVIHYYRFLFGIGTGDQKVRWVYPHPRTDLVAAGHLGGSIAAISSDGTLVVLDAATGAQRLVKSLGLTGPLTGGSFDAHGWRPAGGEKPTANDATAALTMIVRDRDSRFTSIKKFAIRSLAQMPSTDATTALIEIALGSSPAFAEAATEALVTRADPTGAESLVNHLVATDGKRCVAICARALAAIDSSAVKPAQLTRARAVLLALLESPATSDLELAAVALALGRHGDATTTEALRVFFLVHRADPDMASNQEAIRAIAEALAASGGANRAALSFAAADAVTDQAIAIEARRALQLGAASAR